MTFPIYIGAMIAAALFRNIGEYSGKFVIHMGEINDIGGISLSLFLGMAMITLKPVAACVACTAAYHTVGSTGMF